MGSKEVLKADLPRSCTSCFLGALAFYGTAYGVLSLYCDGVYAAACKGWSRAEEEVDALVAASGGMVMMKSLQIPVRAALTWMWTTTPILF